MELFTPGHLLVLAIVVAVLFFGWKQLPDMARSLGRSLRIFKTEIKGMSEDDKAREAAKADPPAIAAPSEPVRAEVVKNENANNGTPKVQPARSGPRPSPNPTGRSETPAAGAQ
jgi:sec-independent protein translocase protein TatA